MSKAVVVGGGTSGLAAAYTLEKAGVDCLALEKRDFAGGRIASSTRDGFILDLGAQFFFSRYRATFELMEKLGIKSELARFVKPLGILRDGTVHMFYPDLKKNLRHPLEGLKFSALSNRGKRKAAKLMLKLFALGKDLDFDDPIKSIELDSVSLAEYTRRHFGDEILEYMMQPIVGALTLGEPEDISAAYGLALAWYAMPGLSTTSKGMGHIAESLASNLTNLKMKTDVTRIVVEDKKVKGIEIGKGKKKEFVEADSVICSTTATTAARLLGGLPASMTDTLSQIRYSACAHVMFAIEEKVMGDVYAVATPRREHLSISGFTEDANKAPGYAPPGAGIMHAFTFSNFAREMMEQSDEEIQKRVTHDIQMVVPRFPDEPIFCEIFRWPEALCLSAPGQITTVQRLKVALREYQGLHLAGEYLGFSSVEAAMNSGVRAAERIIKSL